MSRQPTLKETADKQYQIKIPRHIIHLIINKNNGHDGHEQEIEQEEQVHDF
jgi:hypothetical protein